MSPSEQGGPAVVYAATYRMSPDDVLYNRYVESLCFLWTVSGAGTITCNGETFSATADTLLRLPWGHEVRASAAAPFHFGVAHLVPRLAHDDEFVPRVAVHRGDPLLGAPGRNGDGSSAVIAEIPAHSPPGARMIDLATNAVDRFLEDRLDEAALRALGTLLVDESDAWDGSSSGQQYPPALVQMIRFVGENLRSPLGVRSVADSAMVSTATAERLFGRYTGRPVRAWVRERRMKEAAILLQTTSMHVREVAVRVGHTDAFYFSRVFTATFGVPPSKYAVGPGRSEGR